MEVRCAPVPRPLRTLRFARHHGMLNPQYGRLLWRYLWRRS